MPQTSRLVLWLALLASTVSATGLAEARGSFDCRIPRLELCADCTVNIKITVLQDHECRINYSSIAAMYPQKILVSPKHGRYSAANETRTYYTPNKGFLGTDHFETRVTFELDERTARLRDRQGRDRGGPAFLTLDGLPAGGLIPWRLAIWRGLWYAASNLPPLPAGIRSRSSAG